MKRICPHCSQTIDAEPSANSGASSFPCPACGAAVPLEPARRRTLLQIFHGLNRNTRILGSVALLLLGGLGIYVASKWMGNTRNIKETVKNQVINNDFFKKLIADGVTTAEALEGVASAQAYHRGWIGISAERHTWHSAEALAARTGAEVLDIQLLPKENRQELLAWLAGAWPGDFSCWVMDRGQAAAVAGTESRSAKNLTSLRRVFLAWPRAAAWENRGWTWTIQPQFDEAKAFFGKYARVRKGKLWGLADAEGKLVLAPAYDKILLDAESTESVRGDGLHLILANGKRGLMSQEGKVITPPEWDAIQPMIHGFIPVQRDGKWGYLDAAGKLTIPCEWDDAWQFSAEGFAVVTRDEKRGHIDRTGKVIVPPEWDGAVNFCAEGLALVRRGEGWALINTAGKLLTEPVWKAQWKHRRFDLGFLPVWQADGEITLLGPDGKSLRKFPAKAEFKHFPDSLEITGEEGAILRIGKGGQTLEAAKAVSSDGIAALQYLAPEGFQEGLARAQVGDQFGLTDPFGRYVVPLRQGGLRAFREGLAACRADGLWGFLDLQGQMAISASYEEVRDFAAGYAAVKVDGKWGLIDRAGSRVIPAEWDDLRLPSEGLCAVKRGDLWGFANLTGKVVAVPAWKEVGDFSSGLASVQAKPAREEQVERTFNGRTHRYKTRMNPVWAFIGRDGQPALDGSQWENGGYRDRLLPPRFENGDALLSRHDPNVDYSPSLRINTKGEKIAGGSVIRPQWTKLQLNERERLGDLQDRHGPAERWNAGRSLDLVSSDGAVLLSGSRSGTDFFSDHIPYATPAKYGLMNPAGKIILEPVWDDALVLSPVLVKFRQGEKFGLADKTGKTIIEPVWDYLHVMTVDSGTLEEDGKSIFVGQGGKEILSPWVRVKLGEKVSILQLNGQPAVPESLAGAEYVDFYGTRHVVITQPLGADGKLWSLYEPATGKQTKFPDAATFRWNWNEVAAGALWMKDKTTARWHLMHMDGSAYGHFQPEAEKPDGWGFIEGRGLLHKPEGWHFIDPAGKDISPVRWEEARNFSEGLAAVRHAGKWGFMDLDGKWAIPCAWEEVGDFSRGLAAVRRGTYWGYLDTKGTLAIEPVWDEANAFRPWKGEPGPDGKVPVLDVAEVRMKGFSYERRFGSQPSARMTAALIGRNGQLIVDPTSWNLWLEDFGYLTSPWRWADQDWEKPYSSLIVKWQGESPAVVGRDWRTLYERQQAPMFSPAIGWQFVRTEDAKDKSPDRWRLVDETGKPLTEVVWDDPYYSARMDEFAPGLIHARNSEQKYGLLRKDGSLVVPPKFDRIAWVAPGVATAWSATEGGLLDSEGKWIFEDNDKLRIARFGSEDASSTAPEHRHGLIIIEDTPRWGYARLNR